MKMLSLMLLCASIHARAMDTQKSTTKLIKIIKEKIYITDPRFFEIIQKNNGKIDLQKYIQEEDGQSYIRIKTLNVGKYAKKTIVPLVPSYYTSEPSSRCISPIDLDKFFSPPSLYEKVLNQKWYCFLFILF